MKRVLTLFAMALLGASATTSFAGSLDDDVAKIINIGKNKNQAFQTLETLTGKFGPRLTGSPNLHKAANWAADTFKKYGLTNVHLEEWGEVPVGFQRGARQSVMMTAPFNRPFIFTTPAWSPGTSGPLKGRVVREPKTMEELNAVKDQLKGAWLLLRGASGMRGSTATVSDEQKAVNDAIAAAGIAGKVSGTADERVHTFGRFTDLKWESLPTERRVIIRKSDYDTLSAYLTLGQKVELTCDIENNFYKGPVKQYNVIADIKGSEKPEEMIIVCGHLDSWDGPGSKGANDNGTGTSVAIEAARILSAAKVKPKRTIRFILWTGEEQGLLGSRAYVEKHKDEMKNVSAVLNDDGGTNYQGGYRCLEVHKPMLDAAIAPVQAAFPNLPMTNDVVATFPGGGSSDHAPFVWVGIPGFFTKESGSADYGFVWHTQHDTPKYSVAEYMAQSSTNHAVVSFTLAQADQMLAKFDPPARGGGGRPAGASRNYERWFDHELLEHGKDNGKHEHEHTDDWWEYVVMVLGRMSQGLRLVP